MRTAARWMLFFSLLIGGVALGQASQGGHGPGAGPTSRGHFLKPEQYATQGALTLYVDGASGSDSSTCTSTGADACATLQGAADKIPFLVNNPVTIDITAGNYAGFRLMNHNFAPANATTGAYILIRGAAQANVTPASGSATGTIASVATDAVGFHVVTVTAAGWTVDDFSTRFLTLTGGTGSGQVLPIISNTATTITVSGTFSPAPNGTTTFAVTSPSTIITSGANNIATSGNAAGASAGIIFAEITSPRRLPNIVAVQDIAFSGAYAAIRADNALMQLTRVRAAMTNQPFFVGTTTVFAVISACIASVGDATAISVWQRTTNSSGVVAQRYEVANSFFTSAPTDDDPVVSIPMAGLFTASQINVTSTSGSGVGTLSGSSPPGDSNGSSGVLQISGSRVRCTAASSNTAINLGSTIVTSNVNTSLTGTNSIETCGVGLRASGPNQTVVANGTTTLLSNTLGVSARGGGKVTFASAVPVFTTNTTDISVDGTTSTRAAFVALSPNSIVDLSYLSAVYLQP